MPLTNHARDKFIAPEMSQFTSATIRDMSRVSAQQEHWLSNFILNSIFRVSLASPHRQQLYNFLRRSQSAFKAYALAREATLKFLDDRETHRYIEGIGHWEAFLAYCWQAHCFLGRGKAIWYEKGDESVQERLNKLYNRSKHADSAIERWEFVGDSPLCVWLTNEGLRSTETSLSFDEIAGILEELARIADVLQDPATALEKFDDARKANR